MPDIGMKDADVIWRIHERRLLKKTEFASGPRVFANRLVVPSLARSDLDSRDSAAFDPFSSFSRQVSTTMAKKIPARATESNGHGDSMPPISDQSVRDLAQVFKLLSDETRLRILLYLAQNQEMHVTDLCGKLGQSQPAVSHHLASCGSRV